MLEEANHRGPSYTALYRCPSQSCWEDEEDGDASLGAWYTIRVGSATAVQVKTAEDAENPQPSAQDV